MIGLRLDNRHSVQHRREQAIEPDEEQSICHRQPLLQRHVVLVTIGLPPAFARNGSVEEQHPAAISTLADYMFGPVDNTDKALAQIGYKPFVQRN